MVVEPPPSRFIASTAPRATSSAANSSRRMPTLRGCRPSSVTNRKVPRLVTATAVLGLRVLAWANFSSLTATRPWRTRRGPPPTMSWARQPLSEAGVAGFSSTSTLTRAPAAACSRSQAAPAPAPESTMPSGGIFALPTPSSTRVTREAASSATSTPEALVRVLGPNCGRNTTRPWSARWRFIPEMFNVAPSGALTRPRKLTTSISRRSSKSVSSHNSRAVRLAPSESAWRLN